MNVDKNEAFFHNSCKKVAQLVKVISLMADNQLDRQNEQLDLQKRYEMEVKRCFADVVKQANEVHIGLIKYRKACIDKSCGDFGVLYKQLKHQYNDYVSAQQGRILKVMDEIHKTESEIKSLTASAEATAQSISVDTDSLLNSKKGRSSRLSNQEITMATKEWDEKAKQALQDGEQIMKTLKATHTKQVRQIKNEMNRIFKSILLKSS